MLRGVAATPCHGPGGCPPSIGGSSYVPVHRAQLSDPRGSYPPSLSPAFAVPAAYGDLTAFATPPRSYGVLPRVYHELADQTRLEFLRTHRRAREFGAFRAGRGYRCGYFPTGRLKKGFVLR